MSRNIKMIILLQILLMIYSFSGVLSKMAASTPIFSVLFFLCYGGVILLLGVYAIFWQQIIKEISLTTAYANKAIMVVWGLMWGRIIFRETVTFGKLIGATLIIIGVILFAKSEEVIKRG